MFSVFVPKEVTDGENRVAASPATVKRFLQNGFTVSIESGAGEGSYFSDEEYRTAGAKVVSDIADALREAHLVLMVNAPTGEQVELFPEGCSLVSFLYPHRDGDVIDKLNQRKINAFAVNCIPRVARTQDQDALSSQSNIAGYKAVLVAAAESPKIFPLLMTAAGTLHPAKVLIFGAGVAGLQAVATAKRLGAIVEVTDVRLSAKEQVESLGASFVDLPTQEDMEVASGYAKEASKEFLERQADILRKHIIDADVVITTALVPGKKAPVLVAGKTVEQMKRGSVVIDLAAEQGGNCELTVPGETVVVHGTKIIGTLNLAGTIPISASTVYARNVLSVVMSQLDDKKHFSWALEREDVSSAMLTYEGELKSDRESRVAEALAQKMSAVKKQNVTADGSNSGETLQ